MERRVAALGFSWRDATSTQAYTVHDIGPLVEAEIVRRGAAAVGFDSHVRGSSTGRPLRSTFGWRIDLFR
jgi:hypothetical protein